MKEAAIGRNIQRIYQTILVISATRLIVILLYILFGSNFGSVEELWRQRMLLINMLILVPEILFFFKVRKILRDGASSREKRVVQTLVIVLVLSSGIMMTMIDQSITGQITPLILACVLTGTFYYIKPFKAIILFALAYLAYAGGVIAISTSSASLISNLANGLLAIVLGLSLSLLTWRNFCSTILQQDQIEEHKLRLEALVYQDPLTGLPNRRYLDLVVQREQGNDSAYLIILDIDDFKEFNDTYGHPSGDSVLKELAGLLQENIRGSDVLARLGGEEFIILLKETTLQGCSLVAEKLRKIIYGHEFKVEQGVVKITASFGLAPLMAPNSPGNFYVSADQALYEAKTSGKNQIRIAKSSLVKYDMEA